MSDKQLFSTMFDNADIMLQQYQQALEAAGYVVYITDENGYFIHVSPSVEQLTGYKPEEIVNNHFTWIIVEEWRERVLDFYRTQYEKQTPRTIYRFPIVRRDGRQRWVRQVVVLVKNGDKLHFQGVVQDVTSYKQTEDALEVGSVRYRALLEAIPDLVCVLNSEGVYEDFHARAELDYLLPHPPHEIIGKPLPEGIFPPLYEQQALAFLQRTLRTGLPHSFEYYVKLDDGDIIWLEARMVKLDDNNVLAIVRNVNELKEIETKLASYVVELNVMQWMEQDLAQHLDLAYVLEIGLKHILPISGADCGFIITTDNNTLKIAHSKGNDCNVKKLTASQKKVLKQVMESREIMTVGDMQDMPDAAPLDKEARACVAIPLVTHERVLGALVLESRTPHRFSESMVEFISLLASRLAAALDNAILYEQIGQQFEELQRLYEQVQELEQLKTDMIRIASHDLRGPMATVLGFAELIGWQDENTNLTPQQVDYMREITQAVRRMQSIVNDFLSVERVEETAKGRTFGHIDLRALVIQAADEYQTRAAHHGQHWQEDIHKKPVWVFGDPAQLYEAISNLLSNAIKYTPRGGTVTLRLTIEDDEWALFEVEDSGLGVPLEQQGELFRPFFRAVNVRKNKIEGTGLGLHLVKKIIDRHGGQIVFRSVEGVGSTFGFLLKLDNNKRKK